MRYIKILILAIIGLLQFNSGFANDAYIFVDKEGNTIMSGSTIICNEAVNGEFGDIIVPSGLSVKNVSAPSNYQVAVVAKISRIDNGAVQLCFPTSCYSYSTVGTHGGINKTSLAQGTSKDIQTEWLPTAFGECVVEYTAKTYQGAFPKADYTVTVHYIYDSTPISPTTYILSISATGNGGATYNSTAVRGKTSSFAVNEGTSATVTFAPDAGYQIASVKLNGTDVTSSVADNKYTISNITANTTLAVTFEAIDSTVKFANAKVIYVNPYGEEIKEAREVKEVLVGSTISLLESDKAPIYNTEKTVKWVYESDNAAVTPVTEENTVITVKFKDSGKYAWRLRQYFNDGNAAIGTRIGNWIEGEQFVGDTCTVFYQLAYKHPTDGKWYVAPKVGSYEGRSYTFTGNEPTNAAGTLHMKDVRYEKIDSLVWIGEFEDKTAMTLVGEVTTWIGWTDIVTAGKRFDRFSNGAGPRLTENSYFVINDAFEAGNYKIFIHGRNGGSNVQAPALYYIPAGGVNLTKIEVEVPTLGSDVTGGITIKNVAIPAGAKLVVKNDGLANELDLDHISICLQPIDESEPSHKNYSLSITASGNGSATYNGTAVRGKTQSFTVNEGTSATVTFAPDAGYRIASVKLNGTDVSSSVINNKYTISNITANTTLSVTFEAIPPTSYTFSITASGNGSATYNGTSIRGKTTSFTVNESTSATVTFTPDAGCQIASVKLNGTDVTSRVVYNKYTINNITANTTLAVAFEAIPPTTYSLSITATGNGYVAYDGNTVRGKTSSFSIVEGTNAVLKFSADEGNRLKSVKVNGQDVTSTIVNNQYTVSSISTNTSIVVAFEPIPDYSLNIVAAGNGNAVYNGTTIRNQSKDFTLREGSSATIAFTADAGYRIKSVKVNNTDRTSQVSNGQITVSNIKQNTNVEVAFEEIPPTTYSLTITATGNGAVTYDGNNVRGGSSTFTVVEGSYASIQMTADDGYRLKRVMYNGNDVTANAIGGQYTTDKITANSTIVVEFEAIPTFALTIRSSAFGSVKYGDAVITNQTETFTIREGASAVLTFMPDGNGRLQRITLNGNDITNQLVNGQYTISNIRADQSVEAEYVEDITKLANGGVAYTVTSYEEGTVVVTTGNYGQVLTIPATFTANGKTWTVTGIEDDALANATELAAVIWDPEVPFTAQISNPNLLLYVKRNQYAQSNVQNVVVGDENEGEALQADNIVLTEAESGNNFYCPKAFEAKRISYEHNYSMISGYKDCQGWETLVLPFDVTLMISAKGRELVPYTTWTYGTNLRPFWLYQLTKEGWKAADGIKANVPYIICMPNNEQYESSYNLTGNIQFIGTNVEVKASDNMTTSQYGNKRLVANYQTKAASSDIYALNVSNEWHQNTATEKEGSTFIRSLRAVHPFEAYLTVEGSAAGQRAIPIFMDGNITGLTPIPSPMGEGRDMWYDLQGRKLQGEPTKNGLYINKGKKIRK